MTPKQEERIRNKIAKIRKQLAADKKRAGGFYDDSHGRRYLPPAEFIKLRDYKGGLRYLRWFDRTFPSDIGYPIFLFEWTLILFKTKNFKEAEKKVLDTFFGNNYLFDKFLGKELQPTGFKKDSNWETLELAEELKYTMQDAEFEDFAEWLTDFQNSEKFLNFKTELLDIEMRLSNEPVGKTRSELVKKRRDLIKKE
ncbi:MAG: hypothetical protein JJT94_10695 [Bernardetiaceae bacterium]|nr:hypothetical protein [Bernardetiaceae bacterium]